MRFMMIVKHAEKQGPPPKELMDAIAKLAEEEAKAGTMLGSGGSGQPRWAPASGFPAGKVTVTDGPFTEAKEVVGGYAQFELKSKEEAVESAVRFMELHKKHWPGWEGETEVRQMFGPEDFECSPSWHAEPRVSHPFAHLRKGVMESSRAVKTHPLSQNAREGIPHRSPRARLALTELKMV